MSVVWKPIKGYELSYEVSNNGLVRSIDKVVSAKFGSKRIRRGRILKGGYNAKGYKIVGLSNKSIVKTKKIHRLVCDAFIPNKGNKPTVNHKNGIVSDNRLCNLEWSTYSENITHSYRELNRKAPHSGRTGKYSPFSKPVAQLDAYGAVISVFCSATDAGSVTNSPAGGIRLCCRGLQETCGGYKWEYYN